MYYELYVDVLFLVNFMMDYFVLLLVRKFLSCSATHGRVCLGAIVGSFLTCTVVILPIPYPWVKVILFHTLVNTCMVRVGLKIKTIRAFVKSFIMLYIGSFLLGGIMEVFQPYVKSVSVILAIGLGAYYIVLGIWKFISYVQRWNQYRCNVELYLGNQMYEIKGIIDTGNSLRDPVSDRPVSVLDKKTARRIWGIEAMEQVHYIPYRSVGKEAGVLPVLEVERMCIRGEKNYSVERPLIGISEEEISAGGDYEMILNPNLF